jgi:hypothetical protein
MNAITTEENEIAQATAAAEQPKAEAAPNHVRKTVSRYHLYDGFSARRPLFAKCMPDLSRPGGGFS